LTSALIEGRARSMFMKLFRKGKPPMVEETLFTGLDAKPIPWTLLDKVEMKFIPLLHIKGMYIGGKPSIQTEMSSAIVTSIKARNTDSQQMQTIKSLTAANPELADRVAAQIAKLSMDRQDQLMHSTLGNDAPATPAIASSGPTFSGILPTNQLPGQPTYPPTYAIQSPNTPIMPMNGIPGTQVPTIGQYMQQQVVKLS